MRVLFYAVLVFLVFFIVATASSDDDEYIINIDTMDLKQLQILILKLLNHVTEPVIYKDIENFGKSFKLEENIDLFKNTETVKDFITMLKVGLLPRGEVFTLHVDRQLKEVVMMFKLLYSAKDLFTFVKTACWLRLNVNEGMFVYALSLAFRHREDIKAMIFIPPPYEIMPHYFVRADVIQKAYLVKIRKGLLDHKLNDFYGIQKTDSGVYVIDENVFDKRISLNAEDKLRYFTEDIDLNTYYYYFHVDYPFWMDDFMFGNNSRRFELTFFEYQQILGRYHLERLSNDMDALEEFSWYKPIKNGYWPWMKMYNGVEVPVRFNNFQIYRDNVNVVHSVEDYERIIKDAIIKGHIEINGRKFDLNTPKDVEILGNLVYGTVKKINLDDTHVNAYRYLHIIANAAIGLNTIEESNNYFVNPTVLDYYQTAMRDPLFYQLQKHIANFLILFKNQLPSYTKEELNFPGVKIDNIDVDKLITYFENTFMDMTNAVTLSVEELQRASSDMTFFVRKRRLNHQPFKITIDILSKKSIDSVIRIFLGPKEDHLGNLIDINNNRLNFIQIDAFWYKLNNGKNTVVRNSTDMYNLVSDRMITSEFWKRLQAISDINYLVIDDLRNYHTGFPSRLLLPKGHIGGMNMMIYIIVTPLQLVENIIIQNPPQREIYIDLRSTILLDKKALGFPLDRQINIAEFITPNMKFVDVTIFHKKQPCDMKSRLDRWVLQGYNIMDRNLNETRPNSY